MTALRVLVVEDSTTVRRRLVDVLNEEANIRVVAEAGNGREAIERCLEHRPDVITMDMMLPVMSGLAATEYIMAHCPTPILVVSSSFNRGEVFKTYDALAAGAVDAIEKPTGTEPEGAWERTFLSALRMVARVRVITHPRARLRPARALEPPNAEKSRDATAVPRIVAIGASTGGPSAIVEVLTCLPADFSIPILVVLHLGAPFAVAFADWLDAQMSRPVAYAKDRELLKELDGSVRLAPPDEHLTIQGDRLRLTRDPERHSCRPSVDVLFESVAVGCGSAAAGALLTGMGRDGAQGLLAMRRAGAFTIAQDEQSSVVYGMPREAALLGAADRVLPLAEIGPTLSALAASTRAIR